MSTNHMQEEAGRPDIIERLSYHANERFDMTLDDCLSYLSRGGWLEIPGRNTRELVLQLLALLAGMPSQNALDLDATSRAFVRAHIEAEREQWSTPVHGREEYEVRSIKYLAGEVVLRRVNEGEVPQHLESGTVVQLEVLRHG